MSTIDLSHAHWRKSSRSNGGNNGNCVEVACEDLTWRKSSRSNGGGNGNCVEVAFTDPAVAVRDSKHVTGGALVFSAAQWRRFLRTVRP